MSTGMMAPFAGSAAEPPALFAALAVRLGVIERMASTSANGSRRLDGSTPVLPGSTSAASGIRASTPSAANAKEIGPAAADGHNVERVDSLLARVARRSGMPRPGRTSE
ncbi:MAG TPA: hypothetical protein VH969_15120 [Actinophytocola sp.]|jgi:hypothetical protein|uniref:hypothetical protein n=1 Tax=Actinophytocola sp. TaxID=1872138 RepID=UPI002F948731